MKVRTRPAGPKVKKKGEAMPLRKERFDHLSPEEAIALLGAMEGPLLELELSLDSGDATSGDVFPEGKEEPCR
jgi:hypothetical protein